MKFAIVRKLKDLNLLVYGIFLGQVVWAVPGFQIPTAYVLANDQYPAALRRNNPARIYILGGETMPAKWKKGFMRGDTIINLKGFIDSSRDKTIAYRMIFESNGKIDSAWQLDNKFRLTDQAYVTGPGIMKIVAYDANGKVTDKFVFNYSRKIKESQGRINSLAHLLRLYTVYNSSDRQKYADAAVWVVSIGIDKYTGYLPSVRNCKTDAQSYTAFFKTQLGRVIGDDISGLLFNEYTLLDSTATRENIIKALKDIAVRASGNDYFILNYNGHSAQLLVNADTRVTYFLPYLRQGYRKDYFTDSLKSPALVEEINRELISLNVLQEYIQLIPANNQLFISEAGNDEKFKSEFIKILMRNSPGVASLLNKNRVIIFPNRMGYDNVNCNDNTIQKGPINYYITSLDSSYNIYDIFSEYGVSGKIAFSIKEKEFTCRSFDFDYFDIFFEKKFLQDYKDIFGETNELTRGLKSKSKDLQQTLDSLTGKKYALVVGTDKYKGKGWNNLSNPVKDARAVADEFSNSYGFEVQLLEDKPMDTIYKAIREYYRIAKPNDQLVVYFAGHGDVDDELLDDGFIVCSDSRSVEEDPVRNTYIPYAKLQKMLNNIPARQVLVLLDVCHGGTFDAKAFDKVKREQNNTTISNKNVLQFLKDKLPLRTRKFLSSVGSEAAFDGKAGRHSPFANLLLQVLRAKGSGSNGIVTLTDINAVLNTASLNETATLKISPHMADFGNVDAFSEFIFIPVEEKPSKE